MKKSLFRNRKTKKTHKKKIGKINKKNKKITNKHKNYRNMNMIIGGMEHGEKENPEPPSTPKAPSTPERPRLALKLRTPSRSPALSALLPPAQPQLLLRLVFLAQQAVGAKLRSVCMEVQVKLYW